MTASVAWPIASAHGVRTYNPPMQTAQSVDVAVVGRGAIGAAVALGCAQAGLKVAWVGPAGAPSTRASTGLNQTAPESATDWDARVYALSPATRDLLRQLRIWDALPTARMAPVYDMRVFGGEQATHRSCTWTPTAARSRRWPGSLRTGRSCAPCKVP